MKKISKRKVELNKNIIKEYYSPKEGLELLKELANAKFIESVEAHISLNINPQYSDQKLLSTVILPKGTGKKKKIALLVPEEKILPEYKELADIVGSNDLLETIEKNKINFDVLISTPDMMGRLAKLGKILGRKKLMPSPKTGTVTTDILTTLNEFRQGKIEYRADRTGIVHLSFGKVNFSTDDLLKNLVILYHSIEQNKPKIIKGQYFKTFYICSTMGPSIPVDLNTLKSLE
jgi:large subunit ribosomal protein L1